MKRKEGNCTGKSTTDGTNGEKVHKKNMNIEDLVKRNGISDTSGITCNLYIIYMFINVNQGIKYSICMHVIIF